jgi:hypothetical protein
VALPISVLPIGACLLPTPKQKRGIQCPDQTQGRPARILWQDLVWFCLCDELGHQDNRDVLTYRRTNHAIPEIARAPARDMRIACLYLLPWGAQPVIHAANGVGSCLNR